MKHSNKGQAFGVNSLVGFAIVLVVVTVVISIGAQIVNETGADLITGTSGCNSTHQSACGADYNATVEGEAALQDTSEKMGLIVIAVTGAIVLGIVITLFRGQF